MRKLSLAILLLASLVLQGCASEEKRPAEEGVITDSALAVIDSVRKTYSDRSFELMGSYTTPEMKKKITNESKGFNSAVLQITPKWVDIEQERLARTKKIRVRVMWKGVWTIGDRTYERQGNAAFILDGDPLVLYGVEGNSPFIHPE